MLAEVLCSLTAVALAGGGGGKAMETTLQDDALFLHRAPAEVRASARRLKDLGADRLRLTAGWGELSPAPRARRVPPAPFDASDSATYPDGAFRRLDTAVRAAHDAGLEVMLDVAFWAPRWAVRRGSGNGRERWWPDADRFGEFAEALAKRYSGGFRDPALPARRLPAVRMWTPWNEPNHPSFLAPQWTSRRSGRARRPQSPHVYRAMYESAHAAIKRVSESNRVLLGGTASTGSSRPGGGVRPLAFVRALACVDARLRPLGVPECRGFRPLRSDGFAHHPYARATTPGTPAAHPDDVPLADMGRLSALLGALAERGRLASRPDIYVTEFGYETREDDPYAPFGRVEQAEFLGWSAWLAHREPDTRMFAQFLLQDIDPRESGRLLGTRGFYRDWQSGLFDAEGRAKPAAQAFKLPFWARREGPLVVFWGEVRPNRGTENVRVERRDPATGVWTPIPTTGRQCSASPPALLTDQHGVFERAAPAEAGAAAYRFAWRRPDGSWEPSGAVEIPAAT